MSEQIRRLVDDNPMSRFQLVAVTICVLIYMMDGFDVLVMAFTAPAISEEWGLNGSQLGSLFSSGLAGMAVGSLFLAPLADKHGRRNNIIFSIVITIIGMLLSAFTQNYVQLMLMRFLTGLGIGGLLASTNTIASEYSPEKYRGFVIGIVTTGYTVGAVTGGISVLFISDYGWRAVFGFGAICSCILLPVVLHSLPESLEFLLANPVNDRFQKINKLVSRMGHSPLIDEPPVEGEKQEDNNALRQLWSPQYRSKTILMWTTFFITMATLYFVLNWTPKLLVTAGLTADQGISGGILLNISGVVGQLLLGYASVRFNLFTLIKSYMFLTCISMIFFGWFVSDLQLAMLFAIFIGFFIFGVFVGLYTLSPRLYPVAIRNTGLGWAIGIGRIGAVVSPLAAGFLVDIGWSTFNLFLVFSIPMLISVVAMKMTCLLKVPV